MQTAKLSYTGGKGFMFKGFAGVTCYHSPWKIIIKIFDVIFNVMKSWKGRDQDMQLQRGKGLRRPQVKAAKAVRQS